MTSQHEFPRVELLRTPEQLGAAPAGLTYISCRRNLSNRAVYSSLRVNLSRRVFGGFFFWGWQASSPFKSGHPRFPKPLRLSLGLPSLRTVAITPCGGGGLGTASERAAPRISFASRHEFGDQTTRDGANAFHAPQSAWSASRCLVPERVGKFGP